MARARVPAPPEDPGPPSRPPSTLCPACGLEVSLEVGGSLSRPSFRCPNCRTRFGPLAQERSAFVFPWLCPRCGRHAGYRVLGTQIEGGRLSIAYACRHCGVALGKRKLMPLRPPSPA